ncbi:uncharacterized protein LOC131329594 isoform X1 [Rhododendron vialii]|uniref:uncharacterized protein LOC131329594 isoform X1 n=1 Tax=Rhododendron vialii TaxID=182163 RepID=UPI00265F0703|nr:uncharacterized protein LOC131329594 isoform X1 [Rhododendron vialii]XP_058218793.1 uncharacterized protein LOC131329594 isoform X1 [Rhododendron vialii]
MGSPMTQNLINAGCDVAVWNRTESKCNPPLSRWVQMLVYSPPRKICFEDVVLNLKLVLFAWSLMNLRNTCSTETTCQSYDDAYEKPGVTEIAIMEQNAGNQQERIDQTTLKY